MTEHTRPPNAVRRIELPESQALATLASVFEDLQYVLRCCEHLVTALGGPDAGPVRVEVDDALVEALWTGALVGYVRCFSARTAVLTAADAAAVELPGSITAADLHRVLTTLRDQYASRHVNPREAFTIGAAQSNAGDLVGVAVVSAPRPVVDATTVRLLGRLAYSLSAVVDARMQEAQNAVLGVVRDMSPRQLSSLPLVHLADA